MSSQIDVLSKLFFLDWSRGKQIRVLYTLLICYEALTTFLKLRVRLSKHESFEHISRPAENYIIIARLPLLIRS